MHLRAKYEEATKKLSHKLAKYQTEYENLKIENEKLYNNNQELIKQLSETNKILDKNRNDNQEYHLEYKQFKLLLINNCFHFQIEINKFKINRLNHEKEVSKLNSKLNRMKIDYENSMNELKMNLNVDGKRQM